MSKAFMLIMVGIPGSGKSHFVNSIRETIDLKVCSADHYMMVDGAYVFNPEMLSQNHQLCQDRADDLLSKGQSVVIDNTNVSMKSIKPYLDMAIKNDVAVLIYWNICSIKSAARNVHGVGHETLQRMYEQQKQLFHELTGIEGSVQSCTFNYELKTYNINVRYT